MKNQKLSLLAVVSACLLALFGCSPSGSSSSEDALTGPIADLQGTWSTSCLSKQLSLTPIEDVYQIWTFNVSSTEVTKETISYSDSECSTPILMESDNFSGGVVGDNKTVWFVFSGDIQLDNASGYGFTAKAAGATVTVYNTELLKELNNENYCKMSWELDVPNDVSEKTCSSTSLGTSSYLPKDQTVYFNNFTVVDDKLYVGDFTISKWDSSVWGLPYTKR